MKEWARDPWNFVDFTSYLLIFGAYAARLFISEEYFEVVLVLYSISFLLNVMRFYQLFYISERLGPKITMILGMVSSSSYAAIKLLYIKHDHD